MSDDLETWLRRQAQLRLTLATIAPVVDVQGNEPTPPAPAYRQYVAGVPWYDFTRDSLIRHLVTSGVLVTSESPGAWFGNWPMDDLTPLMAAGDPQDATARCMAELAILDLYDQQSAKAGENAMEEDRAWMLARVVRLLGSGYKHRAGYRDEWLPESD